MDKNASEIEKLSERIAKDPKSKLFVPLAEEYKKSGDIETAIRVLREGLKNNPGYVTARAFLGRLLMEKGDLTGAQKDLEEVIKAIPDNLLAQRKLGDLYVLLGRGSDAIQRYKAALALNPGDKEVQSLLTDLEAGKDVSSRIPRPKVLSPAPATKPQPVAAAPVPPKTAAVKAAPSPAVQPKSPTAAKTPAAPATPPPPQPKAEPAAAMTTKPAAPAQPSRDEIEVVEEIVELEPIERPAPAAESKGPALQTLAQPAKKPSIEAVPPPVEAAFDLNEPQVEPPLASWAAEEPVVPPQGKPATVEEGNDDLNTNTLAELYISQGFYDKAIEVYQGMLAERPENKALQLKLDRLRALAGAPALNAGMYTAVPGGPGEYTPPAADIAAEPAVASPIAPPQPAESPASVETQAVEPPRLKQVQEQAPGVSAPRPPQTATLRRKETIDRLESWLKNIMKEKEE